MEAVASVSQERGLHRVCPGCGVDTEAVHFCERCGRILPTPQGLDYFALLGVEHRLDLDPQMLERSYYALSRRCHPDVYQMRSSEERELSLEKSSAINVAYATLADPVQRTEYLLKQEGLGVDQAGNRVPPAIAAQLFEVQEALVESQSGERTLEMLERLAACATQLQADAERSVERLTQLGREWSQRPDRTLLEQLQQEAVQLRYLRGHAAQAVAALAAGSEQSQVREA